MPAKRTTIGVVTACASNYPERETISGIIARLQERGCDTAVFSNIYNFGENGLELLSEHRIYELIRSRDISGLILLTESFADVRLKKMVADLIGETDLPVIAAGARLPEFPEERCVYINTDDSGDMELLTSHLIEAHSCTSIDLLTGPSQSEVARLRTEGYIRALKRHGIPVQQERIHCGDFWTDSGSELAQGYISGQFPLPEAIVCASCHMAFGLLSSFVTAGIKVPEQVTVVTYEYSDERILYSPLLTSLRRARRELGEEAAERICMLLNGQDLPEFSPPPGELICGRSCTCPCDYEHYISDLTYTQRQRENIFFTVFNTMEQRFVDCRNIEEFTRIISEYQWMIRDSETVYLCLLKDWYDLSSGSADGVVCHCVTPWAGKAPFEAEKLELSAFFADTDQPAAYYFVPIFLRTHIMGHAVLRYSKPIGYDSFLHHWLKTVAVALEYLRMKNDLRSLLMCQDLSETRDSLTGLYSEMGLRYVYGTISEVSGGGCIMAVLRVCLFEESSADSRRRISAVSSAAEAVKSLCTSPNIAGRISEDTFVCLLQSGTEELAADALTALLLQQSSYLKACGVSSFVCSAEKCSGRSFSEVLESCREKNSSAAAELKKRRSAFRYKQLSGVRQRIYLSPGSTFEPEDLASLASCEPDAFRHSYKKCFGASFHKDRINARLSLAKQLLLTTDMSTTQISELCGYSDSKYFLHQFSKETGLTPISYRRAFAG
ncbi:MAG: substrate-binding domain-containing protein [Ruminococcus sp.]|nr:substrate-binding domain-containing protein [Ruminococcus sp.]